MPDSTKVTVTIWSAFHSKAGHDPSEKVEVARYSKVYRVYVTRRYPGGAESLHQPSVSAGEGKLPELVIPDGVYLLVVIGGGCRIH